MTPDQTCFDFIKSREGLKLTAYQDSAGIWTIGFGSILYNDGSPVKKGDKISQDQADQLIEREIRLKSLKVTAGLAPAVVNQHQYDALVSFAYNVGSGALLSSTLLKLVKANPSDPRIRDAFIIWDKVHKNGVLIEVPGLKIRRSAEADLYFS